MKLAAMEGLYNGTERASIVAIGYVKEGEDAVGIRLPGLLSLLATRHIDGFVPGINDLLNGNEKHGIPSADERMSSGRIAIQALKDYRDAAATGNLELANYHKEILEANFHNFGYGYFENKGDLVPPVKLTFYAFHAMISLGIYFILFTFMMLILSLKDKLQKSRLLLKLSIVTVFLGYLATLLGWVVAELGRQPWAIQDILPVHVSISSISAGNVKTTFFIFVALFTSLLIAELGIIFRLIKKGPNLKEEEE